MARPGDVGEVAAFPRQYARSRRFTLGVPRSFRVSVDGSRAAFLRSSRGDDPVTSLWVFDVDSGTERLVADARLLGASLHGDLPAEERARRERAREASSGIVRFTADTALHRAVVDVNGAVFAVDLDNGEARRLPARTPAVDPRLDPSGATVAYVSGGALRVIGWDGTADRPLLEPESDDVTYGLAEFVAAEEMDREEGFWWS
ncbi:MAG: DPP IV N-terminal domain-containing protein, partial [Candidatus Dormibacteraeota bacterium]|nr:DPP IV N-terminal domain-containing protein [Candidatus Dormibacteraeota bacterium]